MDAKNLEKLLKFLGFKVHHKENVTKKVKVQSFKVLLLKKAISLATF